MIISNILALLLAGTAATSDTTSTEPVSAAPAEAEKPKKICKSVKLTGSRLGKRECRTQAQWDEAKSGMEISQKSGRGNLETFDPLSKPNP